ncbi:hypothetical protein A2954_03335 [Candidatus Roizmanbacteria bacterium RIFCSPLOWO2_01_FULL_37_12]|uniref:histidine kinase n=1 Tax=Candidatus Roizmanbacteria bacterium RIFCSPLOWO2_01_FULL_37_12 TaxID=1802056 RepID=A0A1F7IBA7_9BACT|nr:MAG: hypothetical protein A2954_03335 [Candidatus Roizmanbacteria bacterium RIFCSPLOWO2_01_FULL_37_12]
MVSFWSYWENLNFKKAAGKKIQENPVKPNNELEEAKKALASVLQDSKRLEEKLREERDRANAIITFMAEGLLVMDRDYKIVIINPVAEKLLGVSASLAIGQKWSDFVTTYIGEKEIPFEERTAIKTFQSGKTLITTIEDNHYYKARYGGRKFPVASFTSSLIDKEGRVSGVVKVFRDVTHEKQEKEIIKKTVEERTLQVRQEQAKLTASIQSLPVGFMIIDRDENILAINAVAKKILDLKNEDPTSRQICEKFTPVLDLRKMQEKSLADKKALELKDIALGKKVLRILLSPISLSAEEIIGSVILFEDVTEAKILERSKDEFFSIASHELRTPLTAIRGNTALIQQYFSDILKDSTLKEMILDIHDSSIRLIQIVNDFLNVSRLEQGRIEFVNEEFDIRELVLEVFKELEFTAHEKNLFLKFDSEQRNAVKVYADRDRTKEVLINLIGNSLKFTDQGGVTVSILPNPNFLKIAIIDSGRGIPVKNQSLLFHKFQQASEQILTRDFTRGTGLGLYISKLLIEGMEGKIWLENTEEGKGSTFSFTLPLAN